MSANYHTPRIRKDIHSRNTLNSQNHFCLNLCLSMAFIFSIQTAGFAQLSITPGPISTAQLSDLFPYYDATMGQVIVPNTNSYGTFTAIPGTFAAEKGIVVSTGKVLQIPGTATSSNISYAYNFPGNIAGSHDGSTLKFLVQSPIELSFTCIFASCQYPNVYPSFDDQFQLLITGPNPQGGTYQQQNIALVPGTNTPISTMSINSTSNSQFYVTNNASSPYQTIFRFKAYTDPLTFSVPAIPGEVYLVELIIADKGDPTVDSGVFLWSDFSPDCEMEYFPGIYGYPGEIYEGEYGILRVKRTPTNSINNLTQIELVYDGTASVSDDFSSLPQFATIQPGSMYVDIPIFAMPDNISEGDELLTISNPYFQSLNSVSITIRENFVFNNGLPDNLLFCDADTAFIELNPNMVDSFLNYQWNTGDTTQSIMISGNIPLSSWYFVTITDHANFVYIDSILIHKSPKIYTSFISDPNDCGIDYIHTQVSGALPPYYFNWSDGSTAQHLDDLHPSQAGIYTLSITDSYECVKIIEYNLEINPFIDNQLFTGFTCIDSTGIIQSLASGGTGPISYLWSNGSTNSAILNATAGSYYLTLTDLNGCTRYDSLLNFNPLPFSASISADLIGCSPATLSWSAEGGIPPYELTIDPSAFMQSADTLLIPGIYPVIISDAGNCSISSNLIVEIDTTSYIQASLNYEILDAIHPVKITTTLFSGGNYSYLWNNGMTSSEIFVNQPGLYNLIISDTNNCYSVYEILIPDTIDFFSFNISTSGSKSCLVGSGTINLVLSTTSNNIQVNWSTGDTDLALDSLLAGWYYFTMSDGYNSVELIDSVQVLHLANFMYEIIPSCLDTNGIISSITVEIAGGAFDSMTMTDLSGTVILPDVNGNFQNLYADEYELLMTDTLGCEIEVLIDMQLLNSPIILAQDSFEFCGPTELTVDAFYLSQGSQNWYQYRKIPYQSNPYSGTPIYIAGKDDQLLGMYQIGFEFNFFGESYTHFYLSTNGWIKFPPVVYPPAFDNWQIFGTPDIPTRNRGIMPALRDWQPGANSKAYYQTSGVAPNRTLTVSWDSIPLFSCQTIGKFQVVLYENSGIIDFNLENVPNCPIWNSGKGTQGLQNADGTQYRTTLGRNASSWAASMETVRYYPSIYWINDDLELIGYGNSLTTFVNSTSTLYAVSGNCPDLTQPISVDLLPVEYEALPTAICSEDPLELSIPSDLSVEWYNGSTAQSIEVTEAGAYTLTVTNSFGCQKTDSVWIYEEILPEIIPSDTIYICSTPIEFTVDQSLAPLWSTGSTSHFIQLMDPGDYWLIIHGQHCTQTEEFTLIQEVESFADFTYTIDHQNFSVEILNTSANSWAYEWNFGDGSQTSYETNPVHFYPYGILDAYPISLISSNYCYSDTLTQWVQFLSDSELEYRYTLYPNPSLGKVELEGKHRIDKISVYTGLSVKLQEISVHDFKASLDLGGFPAGVYLLEIESAGNRQVKRLSIVEK